MRAHLGRVAAAVLAVLSLAPLSSAQTSWRFRFDRALGLKVPPPPGNGLTVSFSRGPGSGTSTIDPTGVNVNGLTPRYDRAFRMPAIPAPDPANYVLSTPFSQLLGSGFDYDGIAELMLFFDRFNYPDTIPNTYFSNLHVFVDDNIGNSRVTKLPRVHLNPAVVLPGDTVPPAFAPGGIPADHLLQPRAGAVFHGAVIVAGQMLKKVQGQTYYDVVGWGFAININQGDPAAWQFLWSDIANPVQVNHARGQNWCLKVAPVYQRNVVNPTEFWLVCTDYRANSNSPPFPSGGRVYVARFTRPDPGSGAWEVADAQGLNRFFFTDFPQGTVSTIGCHAHSCHMVEWGSTGLQVIVSLGDSLPNNRFARMTRATHDGDYTTGWTVTDDYHGRRTAGSNPSERGTWSAQPVGVAWGPYLVQSPFGEYSSSLIWATDIESEWLYKVTPPLQNAAINQLKFGFLYGLATGYGSALSGPLDRLMILMDTISEWAPERQGPLVAAGTDTSTQDPRFGRILYCHTSRFPDRWIPVASVKGQIADASAVYFRQKVWYTQYEGTNPGLYHVPAPTGDSLNVVFQPVVVSPGGTNLVHANYFVPPSGVSGFTVTQIGLNNPLVPGVFKDGSTALPPVPTLATKAYRIQTDRTQTIQPLEVRLSSDDTTTYNKLPTTWNAAGRIRRVRGYVLDASYGQSSPTPNKTIQLSSQIAQTVGTPPSGAPTQYSCPDRWCPVTLIGYRTLDAPDGPVLGAALNLRPDWGSGGGPDDNRFYMVIDIGLDDLGSLSYPIKHWSSGPLDTAPDEILTIATASGGPNLTTSTSPWTLRLAGIVPEGDVDNYALRVRPGFPDTDLRRWPLFTLWADDSNYIEFFADSRTTEIPTGNGLAFRVRTTIQGVKTAYDLGQTRQLWLPNSPLYVAIAYQDNRIYVGASLGAGPVEVIPGNGIDTTGWPTSANAFSQLRFRAGPVADSSAGEISNEVVTFRWIGGEFSTTTFDNSTLPSAFSSIDWMKGP